MRLTIVEQTIMAKIIATAIREDDFAVDWDVFREYARATYPLISLLGIENLWKVYKADPTI